MLLGSSCNTQPAWTWRYMELQAMWCSRVLFGVRCSAAPLRTWSSLPAEQEAAGTVLRQRHPQGALLIIAKAAVHFEDPSNFKEAAPHMNTNTA